MKIDVICSDRNHPIRPRLESWAETKVVEHCVRIVERAKECTGGDLLFMISCNELIRSNVREKYDWALVIHASDLPLGRGWSPMVWQVLEGASKVVLTLFEAVDDVDAGEVLKKSSFSLSGDELYDELNEKLFDMELELMDYAVQNFNKLSSVPQPAGEPSFYRKRTPEDSQIDPKKTFVDQFNLLRVADPVRYPCFFDWKGCRYKICLEKMNEGVVEE